MNILICIPAQENDYELIEQTTTETTTWTTTTLATTTMTTTMLDGNNVVWAPWSQIGRAHV